MFPQPCPVLLPRHPRREGGKGRVPGSSARMMPNPDRKILAPTPGACCPQCPTAALGELKGEAGAGTGEWEPWENSPGSGSSPNSLPRAQELGSSQARLWDGFWLAQGASQGGEGWMEKALEDLGTFRGDFGVPGQSCPRCLCTGWLSYRSLPA